MARPSEERTLLRPAEARGPESGRVVSAPAREEARGGGISRTYTDYFFHLWKDNPRPLDWFKKEADTQHLGDEDMLSSAKPKAAAKP